MNQIVLVLISFSAFLLSTISFLKSNFKKMMTLYLTSHPDLIQLEQNCYKGELAKFPNWLYVQAVGWSTFLFANLISVDRFFSVLLL